MKELFPYGKGGYEILDREICYKGYFEIQKIKIRFRTFAGGWEIMQREYFKRHYAVSVLLYDNQSDQIVLVQQFRLGVCDDPRQNPWMIECVAGMLDKNESPEENARRETQEESGLNIKKLVPIYNFWTSPGVSNEKVYLFCGFINANEIHKLHHGIAEESEDIKIISLSFAQAKKLLHDGIINNAYTIIALQWLEINHQSLRLQQC